MMHIILGWGIAAILVLATIGIHYEIMKIVSDLVVPWALRRFHDRRVMMLMIVTLMLGHIAEIWTFAFAMYAVSNMGGLGHVTGNIDQGLNAYAYFSAVTYTSLGYGDIVPHGVMRAISVSEALAGLLMLAWSASFTYLKMEQIWNLRLWNLRRDAKGRAD